MDYFEQVQDLSSDQFEALRLVLTVRRATTTSWNLWQVIATFSQEHDHVAIVSEAIATNLCSEIAHHIH